jgi:hypothetical protein
VTDRSPPYRAISSAGCSVHRACFCPAQPYCWMSSVFSSIPMDSHYAQASLSPTDFFNGLELTPQVQPGPRSYKSRKYRPCDFCRARQVACKIDVAPPCQLCAAHGRGCTFVERPKKKRRPNASVSNGEPNGQGASGKLS